MGRGLLRHRRRIGQAIARRQGHHWEGGTRRALHHAAGRNIPAGADTWDMLMSIDFISDHRKLVAVIWPRHKIDGLDVWPIISRQPGAKNPHQAYWFIYEGQRPSGRDHQRR